MTNPPNEWRPVAGFPGYEVSDIGEMRSWRGRRKPMPYYLSIGKDKDGYLRTTLYTEDGYPKTVRVHRVQCEAWHGAPSGEKQVARHLNDDLNNNTPGNLAWGTHFDNTMDAVQNGGRPLDPGCTVRKLTVADVKYIRSSTKMGKTLAEELNCSKATVCMIRKGKRWTWIN